MSDAKKDKAAAHEKVTKEKAARINDAANESRGGNSRRDAARESLAREHLSRDSRDGTSVRESDKGSFGVGAPVWYSSRNLGKTWFLRRLKAQADRILVKRIAVNSSLLVWIRDRILVRRIVGQQQSSHMDQGQTHVHQTAQGGTTNVHQTVQGGTPLRSRAVRRMCSRTILYSGSLRQRENLIDEVLRRLCSRQNRLSRL